MAEPRRLRGHNAAATCCLASLSRPGVIVTAAEDGIACWYDLRCKDVLFTANVGNGSPVSSLCFKPGNEDIIYVSAGNEVKCFDLHMIASWKHLGCYNYNKDEINQIACHSKSSFLAAPDDSGDVKVYHFFSDLVFVSALIIQLVLCTHWCGVSNCAGQFRCETVKTCFLRRN
ncbi:transducin/WD40 repeat-like superfamily protein [Striga asiatica]|uniref:Transducin/WD40 repeat-like superfamily protein n=1 Tax=Striga asiatica TaxID=4170 RepID=A0A5A7NV58_STRAF|nr:transducin/WD40 repeat-like superfamily protein [Striga asiatica]